jgi:hypothetical protein
LPKETEGWKSRGAVPLNESISSIIKLCRLVLATPGGLQIRQAMSLAKCQAGKRISGNGMYCSLKHNNTNIHNTVILLTDKLFFACLKNFPRSFWFTVLIWMRFFDFFITIMPIWKMNIYFSSECSSIRSSVNSYCTVMVVLRFLNFSLK